MEHGTSLVVHTPKAGDMGSIHDRELRSCLPHGMAKKKKKIIGAEVNSMHTIAYLPPIFLCVTVFPGLKMYLCSCS